MLFHPRRTNLRLHLPAVTKCQDLAARPLVQYIGQMAQAFDVIPFEVCALNLRRYPWCESCPRLGYQGELEETGGRFVREGLQRSLGVLNSLSPALIDTTGSYLGIDVAIKEVLPSSRYDVAKYFEREWRLMK